MCWSYLILINLFSVSCSNSPNTIEINGVNIAGKLSKFWQSTGLSPPANGEDAFSYLISEDVMLNLAAIGSLPFKAIKYMRIHWLLDLILVRNSTICTNSSQSSYNFDHLDKIMDTLNDFDMRPGFELMGNPGQLFNKLDSNESQLIMWRELVFNVASRYISRYGLDNVKQWRFETWNEPDLRMYNILNFTLPGYIRYFEASRTALDQACKIHSLTNMSRTNKQLVKEYSTFCSLQLGGPAGVFKTKKNHKLCWGFLKYITKKKSLTNGNLKNQWYYGPEVDFLSFHKKGNGSARTVVQLTKQFYQVAKAAFNGSSLPVLINNEADILTGWWRNETWRSDVRYAAAVCQVIVAIHTQLVKKYGVDLFISNDNGFINYNDNPYYFTQRTLLARFDMSNDTANVDRKHLQVFQKPVYVVMGLLAYLYNNELSVTFHGMHNKNLNILATSTENVNSSQNIVDIWCCSVLVVFSSLDNVTKIDETSQEIVLKIILPHEIKDGKYVVYSLDNVLPHPAAVWNEAGRPNYPDPTLRAKMRHSQGPHRVQFSDFKFNQTGGEELHINVSFTLPSVLLVHICQYSVDLSTVPGKVTGLRFINITYNEVFILWKDEEIKTKCIKTYEIEFCSSLDKDGKCSFERINNYDVVFPSYHYAFNTCGNAFNPDISTKIFNKAGKLVGLEPVRGQYRIRVVDYWDRNGSYSEIVSYE